MAPQGIIVLGRHLLWLLSLALVCGPGLLSPALAAQQGPAPLTLEQSIRIALERNLDMRMAREEVDAARQQQKEARTGFLPKLRAEYSYRHPSEVPWVLIGPQRFDIGDRNEYRFTGTIEQPLFTGFATLSNYQLARLGLDVARINLSRARLDLVLQVKEAYYGILSAEKIQQVARQAVQQLQSQLEVARNFYRVGMSPKIDVLDAEVRLAEARQELIRAANNLRLAKARFNTILRWPVDRQVEVVDILSERPYGESYEICQQISLQKRPELLEAEKKVARARKEILQAKSAYYPSISLFLHYYRAGDDPSMNGSPFLDRENWDVQAAATWTFFEWGKTRFAANQRRARLRQAREAVKKVKDAIRLEVKTAYLNLQTAERNIQVAKKSVESAEENFRISKERYREQVATATEVLDAQTRLTRARTNYTNAVVDFNIARARLLRAMGLGEES